MAAELYASGLGPIVKWRLFLADANDGHEPAGEGALFAKAEEQISAAGGAEIACKDTSRTQTGGEELRAIGFAEVEMDTLGRRLVAGRHHVEPLEGIGLFAGARLVEIISGIGELCGELGDKVGGNFVAAGTNGRADGGEEIRRLAAVFEMHPADGFFGDAGESATPASVDRGDRASFGIDEEDRDAIGSLDGEEEAGSVGGGGVALAWMRGGIGEWTQ